MLEEIQTTLSMVDVRIRVERNPVEEEALHHVNIMINSVITEARNDIKRTSKLCSTLIECCLKSEGEFQCLVLKVLKYDNICSNYLY